MEDLHSPGLVVSTMKALIDGTYFFQVNVKHRRMMIFERRNLASFMGELPDRLPLSSLCLPGKSSSGVYGFVVDRTVL